MSKETIKIPDLGGADEVEVIEVCVKAGDTVEAEQSLVVLESDKASMEIPCPAAGTVVSIALKVGDKVKQGQPLLELETGKADTKAKAADEAKPAKAADKPADKPVEKPAEKAPAKAASKSDVQTIPVPDLGGADSVAVIELCVKPGDVIAEGDSLVVLESDKASMEVPSPVSGTLKSFSVKVGDTIKQGDAIALIESSATVPAAEPAKAEAPAPVEAPVSAPAKKENPLAASVGEPKSFPTLSGRPSQDVYAGPAARMLARELGVDLAQVTGTGPRGRIQKDDLHGWIKNRLAQSGTGSSGAGIPEVPAVDFSRFGEVDVQALSRLNKITAQNMQRSWLNVPHVTQFDDADVTDLEAFRDTLRDEAKSRGVKMTPMPFIVKACAVALKAHPRFNASLHHDGENMVFKQYVNIGIAVDTPAGLMVPVIKHVDKKSMWEIAAEIAELADKAKERKLKPDEMQGGCFTISSLGNIGGNGFTPIVNAPEVAILGVSRLSVKPVWDGEQFQPRKMLPLSLSYDHRVVNGADAGRFMTHLISLLADLRRLAL